MRSAEMTAASKRLLSRCLCSVATSSNCLRDLCTTSAQSSCLQSFDHFSKRDLSTSLNFFLCHPFASTRWRPQDAPWENEKLRPTHFKLIFKGLRQKPPPLDRKSRSLAVRHSLHQWSAQLANLHEWDVEARAFDDLGRSASYLLSEGVTGTRVLG